MTREERTLYNLERTLIHRHFPGLAPRQVRLIDVADYDGRRPAALDLFLDYLGLDEEEFLKLIEPHAVDPHVMPSCETCKRNRTNWVPNDFESWTRLVGDLAKDGAGIS